MYNSTYPYNRDLIRGLEFFILLQSVYWRQW